MDGGWRPQALLLLVSFCLVVTLSDRFHALAASWAAGFLKGPAVRSWSQWVGGAVFIAAILLTLLAAD